MQFIIPSTIPVRRSKEQVRLEQLSQKMRWKGKIEYGDAAHIHKIMNESDPVSYHTVVKTISPNSAFWSPRVAKFVERYLEVRDTMNSEKNDYGVS